MFSHISMLGSLKLTCPSISVVQQLPGSPSSWFWMRRTTWPAQRSSRCAAWLSSTPPIVPGQKVSICSEPNPVFVCWKTSCGFQSFDCYDMLWYVMSMFTIQPCGFQCAAWCLIVKSALDDLKFIEIWLSPTRSFYSHLQLQQQDHPGPAVAVYQVAVRSPEWGADLGQTWSHRQVRKDWAEWRWSQSHCESWWWWYAKSHQHLPDHVHGSQGPCGCQGGLCFDRGPVSWRNPALLEDLVEWIRAFANAADPWRALNLLVPWINIHH